MSSQIGTYDYLNKVDPPLLKRNQTDPHPIKLDMDELANLVVSLNYGTARFLAALVRARRSQSIPRIKDELATEIENLLNRGFF